jgi:hypothetical protein
MLARTSNSCDEKPETETLCHLWDKRVLDSEEMHAASVQSVLQYFEYSARENINARTKISTFHSN